MHLKVNITCTCTFTCRSKMKNVTISLSEVLVHILDSICKDCNLSRYAFAKEALLEKIERHTKNELKTKLGESDQESLGKANNRKPKENEGSYPPFLFDFS